MSRSLLLAFCLLCTGGPAAAQTTFPIAVQSAYLHLDPADSASPALAISLASLGLYPGYTIRLATAGDWDAGPGDDTQTGMLGVFSSNTTLLGPTLAHRVPGAIGAGVSNYSGPTWPNSQPTDIPEDFVYYAAGITIEIPAGATHLFVSPADIYYLDNSDPDGDLGVTITLVAATSVPGGGPGSSRLALSAHPNPLTAGTSVSFQLASAAAVRLSVHDLSGRLVRTLVADQLQPGSHLARWNGRDDQGRQLPAGSYFARLEGGGQVGTVRLVLRR